MKRALLALAALFAAPAAQAQEGFYAGIGLGYSDMQSDAAPGAGILSDADAGIFSATAGYRFRPVGQVSFAVEGNLDFSSAVFESRSSGNPCTVSASGVYYCTHDMTARLRGVASIPLTDRWEAFGTLGVGYMEGTAAVNSGVPRVANAGATYGVGVQGRMGAGMTRIELVRDDFNNTVSGGEGENPTYEATTLTVSYLFSF